MDATPSVYTPILPYQTRIIELHSDPGTRDAPIVCTLYVADILHPNFEGLGLRSPHPDQDPLVEYDAVSYTWGGQLNSKQIICNGAPFNVTENLFDALKAFRYPRHRSRYLWVDAICINQDNTEEKAIQVRNMLSIYQKATTVIAWLGQAHDNTKTMLDAAAYPGSPFNIIPVCEGLVDLYTRPWFRRIWVQQEIYAARDLQLQCGSHLFRWSELLSRPGQLMSDECLKPYHHLLEEATVNYNQSRSRIPAVALNDIDAIVKAKQLHNAHLSCFEKFSEPNCPQPALIDTLLLTSVLDVTNLRDSIYGILGMTGFPSAPMSIGDWVVEGRWSKVLIPIDYSADMVTILSTVTWAILMKGGLSLLVHLKLRSLEEDRVVDQQGLPSWVIDWRLAARLLRSTLTDDNTLNVDSGKSHEKQEKTNEIWGAIGALGQAWNGNALRRTAPKKHPVTHTAPGFPAHEEFCNDNLQSFQPSTNLVLQGAEDTRYFASGNSIAKEGPGSGTWTQWVLTFDVFSTDKIVYFPAFGRERHIKAGFLQPSRDEVVVPGLWLLRPVQGDEYKLLACLTSKAQIEGLPYDHLELDPSLSQSIKESRQFVFHMRDSRVRGYEHPLYGGNPAPLRKFTIV